MKKATTGTMLFLFGITVNMIAQTTYMNPISYVKTGNEEMNAPQVYVPNSFTPNGDGLNDEFKVYSDDIKDYSLKIYDEDGVEVFATIQVTEGWNGTRKNVELKQGVYLYRIDITYTDQSEKTYIGRINLIR